jgi:hypothetical protein
MSDDRLRTESKPHWEKPAVVAKIDQVFVMRFWQELGLENPADPNRWRVLIKQVKHEGSRRQFHAVGIEKAFDIVRGIVMSEAETGGDKP